MTAAIRRGIIPAAPWDERIPTPQGGCTQAEWRGLNDWKWALWQFGLDARRIEWPGWHYLPTEEGAGMLSEIELARLTFHRWRVQWAV